MKYYFDRYVSKLADRNGHLDSFDQLNHHHVKCRGKGNNESFDIQHTAKHAWNKLLDF